MKEKYKRKCPYVKFIYNIFSAKFRYFNIYYVTFNTYHVKIKCFEHKLCKI